MAEEEIDWRAVNAFWMKTTEKPEELKVTIVSESHGEKLSVTVPASKVEQFMKNVPMYQAEVTQI